MEVKRSKLSKLFEDLTNAFVNNGYTNVAFSEFEIGEEENGIINLGITIRFDEVVSDIVKVEVK